MKAFLIDFENVHSHGLNGVENLKSEDRVIIFYSNKSNALSFEIHRKIIDSQANIEYIKIRRGGKNSLDFQLSSLLGWLVRDGTLDFIAVISHDTGFDFLQDFWNGTDAYKQSCQVRRYCTIAEADLSFALRLREEELREAEIISSLPAEEKTAAKKASAEAEIIEEVEIVEKEETLEKNEAAREAAAENEETAEDEAAVEHEETATEQKAAIAHEEAVVEQEAAIAHEEAVAEQKAAVEHEETIAEQEAVAEQEETVAEQKATVEHEEAAAEQEAAVEHEEAAAEQEAAVEHEEAAEKETAREVEAAEVLTEEDTTPLPESCQTILNALPKQIQQIAEKSQQQRIVDLLPTTQNKQDFYRGIIKIFGQKKGLDVYKLIKPEYNRLKSLF